MAVYKPIAEPEVTQHDLGPYSVSWSKAQLEPTESKILIFIPCIVTTIVSLLLLVSDANHWTIAGSSYEWINRDRATVQIIVQVLAGLLGLSQISTLRNLVNYSARHMLVQRVLTLDELGFYNALTTSQINWGLPKLRLCIVLLTAGLALGPAALWAGGLTPINSVDIHKEPLSLLVPTYSVSTEHLWTQGWAPGGYPMLQTSLGSFTYAPQRERYAYFINDGSSASSLDGGPQLFKKGDNSNYTYHGRSYGIGTSVGLVDESLSKAQQLTAYRYLETGYQSNFTCIRNESSSSEFVLISGSGNADIPPIYMFRSSSPISSQRDDGYIVADLAGADNITTGKPWPDISTWQADSTKPLSYLDIQAKGGYTRLKGIQCAGRFIPTQFSVHVDVVDRLITVSPNATEGVENIDPIGILALQAGDTFAAMSMMSSNTYICSLGDMLLTNIFNVQQQGTNETTEELILRGTAESLQALADQALFSIASAQLMIAKDTISTPVTASIQSLRIGKGAFIYASCALNALLVLVLCFQAVSTRLWDGMPRFNFADVKSVIVGTSHGGDRVAEIVQDGHKSLGGVWSGERNDRMAGNISVKFVPRRRGLALVVAALS
ncbi:hypothetical protein N431DRAFT_427521 [Stipitochalara longipes BDJ]|nr:hypothetical protein N431DRAFT_427521 [Stipitochalara longipes BDJ]